ncbi:MAG: hypothetical protein EBY62_12880, partial [Cellvibrionales bacterium]|nr:hypothetical protein [Cellvibrionales bacterium]
MLGNARRFFEDYVVAQLSLTDGHEACVTAKVDTLRRDLAMRLCKDYHHPRFRNKNSSPEMAMPQRPTTI